MVRYHHQLNGHEFERTPGESGEQSSSVLWHLQSVGSQRVRHDLGLNNNNTKVNRRYVG